MRPGWLERASIIIVGAVTASGCYSGVSGADLSAGDAGEGPEGADSAEEPPVEPPVELQCEEVASQPLRRVSSAQYANIVAELLPGELGIQAGLVSTFPTTRIQDGFSTFSAANTVSSSESIAIEDNAEAIATLLYEGRAEFIPALMPCVSAGYMPSEIDGCIDEFIADFGQRAFRRPLSESESTRLGGLYDDLSSDDGPEMGLAGVVQYVLESPALLYLVERGLPSEGPYTALDPYELGTRLSMFLRSAGPDDALLAAAAEGRLATRDDVEREARRLLEGPGANPIIGQFHREWLRGFVLDQSTREHEAFTPDAQLALLDEVDRFTDWFLTETDGSLETLLTTDAFPVDPALAELYGTEAGTPAPHRYGVFTLASVMASQAHENRTSLIERGAFVRNHLLCSPTPPFPGDIDIEATLGGHAERPTARERYEPLMTEPACSGCHVAINPFGFAFEVYDWAGAYRTTENGATIDTSFDLTFGSIEGSFSGPGDLLAAIGKSEEAHACYATHAFRFALGRMEALEDRCALEEVRQAFIASEGDVRELMVAIVTSDAFMFRTAGGAQ